MLSLVLTSIHNHSMFLTAQYIGKLLPSRVSDAHKGHHGSTLLVGGTRGMSGAVVLAYRAAIWAGSGRTYACFLDGGSTVWDPMCPEIMIRQPKELSQIQDLTSWVVGPGLGQSPAAMDLLVLGLNQPLPLLLDADALNLLAGDGVLSETLRLRKHESVITPHPGEAARLWGQKVEPHQRQTCAQALAKQFQVVCVLKGSATVVAHPDGRCCINSTGNVGLASGGTGDVLSGIIGSLMAQGLSAFDAACAGVYLHGVAADELVARGVGPVGLTASEVALEVRSVINRLHGLSEIKPA